MGEPDWSRERQLATLVLPYLSGVPLGLLSRILDDESHYLADLRVALKDILNDIPADPERTQEVLNDRVRPATDKVERRFRTLASSHGVKIAGAAFTTVVLTLTALTGQGILAALGAFFGASALKEVSEYVKAREETREMPLYLLWRIGKASRLKV
jgi:hypothetical protein